MTLFHCVCFCFPKFHCRIHTHNIHVTPTLISGNKDTHNIVMYMFSPISLRHTDGPVIWKEDKPGSPLSCRPLALMLGKETDDNLKIIYKRLSQERLSLTQTPLQFKFDNIPLKVTVNLRMTMIDGKMRTLLTGAY